MHLYPQTFWHFSSYLPFPFQESKIEEIEYEAAELKEIVNGYFPLYIIYIIYKQWWNNFKTFCTGTGIALWLSKAVSMSIFLILSSFLHNLNLSNNDGILLKPFYRHSSSIGTLQTSVNGYLSDPGIPGPIYGSKPLSLTDWETFVQTWLMWLWLMKIPTQY